MIRYFFLSMFFGFFSAAVMHKIFWNVLRFRAEWSSTFVACMLTCFVSGLAFGSSVSWFEKTDEYVVVKVMGTSFAIATITGLLAFRLIIKSGSGRSMSWVMAGLASLALCVPPLLLFGLVGLLWQE